MRSFSGPYFPIFELNTGIYGPEKTLHVDTFYTVTNTFCLTYLVNFHLENFLWLILHVAQKKIKALGSTLGLNFAVYQGPERL